MSAQPQTRLSVNRPMLLASVGGAMAWLTMPNVGAPLVEWFPTAAYTFLGTVGGLTGIRGMRNRYVFRKNIESAKRSGDILGGGRFATLTEIAKRGMLDPKAGPPRCLVDGVPVFGPDMHHVGQGPTGTMKTTSIIVPAILHELELGRSVVVPDIKPELVYMMRDLLIARGFRVTCSNYAGIGDIPCDDYNPLSIVIEEVADPKLQARAFITASEMSFEITPEPEGDGKNKYFRDLERALFQTIVIALAVLDPDACLPSMIYTHAADPRLCEALLRDAEQSDALHGDLGIQAANFLALKKDEPSHYEGARSGLANALNIFRPSSDLGMMGVNHGV
ncbi:MAG: type IV secretory system conjugative DNA transfer family protein [Pseudomonadota bacterium]